MPGSFCTKFWNTTSKSTTAIIRRMETSACDLVIHRNIFNRLEPTYQAIRARAGALRHQSSPQGGTFYTRVWHIVMHHAGGRYARLRTVLAYLNFPRPWLLLELSLLHTNYTHTYSQHRLLQHLVLRTHPSINPLDSSTASKDAHPQRPSRHRGRPRPDQHPD